MSSQVSTDGARAAPSGGRPRRRAATAERLASAAVDELRAVGYDGLSVRNVARRAECSPATAYLYFASKDHLVAEAFWRAVDALPPVEEELDQEGLDDGPDGLDGHGPGRRVGAAIAPVVGLCAAEPALAAAATTALLADEPDVARLRRLVGADFRQRFVAALGEGAPAAAVDAVDLAFSGALLRAGVGELPYERLVETMGSVAEALVPAGERRP